MASIAAYFVSAVLMFSGTVLAAVKADHAAKIKRHAACLVRTAQLERELGIGIPFDELFAAAVPNLVQEVPALVAPPRACGDIEAQNRADREWGKRLAKYQRGQAKGL